MTVRTRFAPSPTGYLHIGGVRTALFNWLFARKHSGKFILRIDDTDQQRNVAEALQPILDGFRWLGIDWDEGPEVGGPYGPYYQSQRQDRYRIVVQQLVDKGAAYHDYATPDELKAERESAEKEKRLNIYSRRWMAKTPADRAKFEAEGRKATIRLKMPRDGVCRIDDQILGPVEFRWADEQDHVIQRADGSCMYNLATVADEHDMDISHVIRAQEHLANTPRQIFVYQALGWPLPVFAHVPTVAAPGSKEKLSKRKIKDYLKNAEFKKIYDHGKSIADRISLVTTPENFNPVLVEFYEKVGYLPHAILNYLLLLGWAYDDKKEEFSRAEMIDLFCLEKVNKAPAGFDPKKLLAFQEREMQKLPIEDKVRLVLPYTQKAGWSGVDADRLTPIVRAAGDRIKVAGDILDYSDFFTADDQLPYDDKAFAKNLRNAPQAVALLRQFRDRLASAEMFDAAALEQLLQEFLQSQGAELKQIIHALRVALTGKAVGFGLYDTMAILGKDRCLARIDRALGKV